VDDEESDKTMEQFATDVAEAIGAALRASEKEWRPIPLLPLTIGLNRLEGEVNRHQWWSCHLRFTWLVEDA
jgi:hypothetical protein